MKKSLRIPVNREGIFFYLALLTVFFILLEISFFIQCNKAYLAEYTYITGKIHIPFAVLPDMLLFFGAQLLVHAGYCLLVWVVTLLVADFFRLSNDQCIKLSMGIWLIGMLTVLFANQYYFPNSKFSELNFIFLNLHAASMILDVLLLICAGILLIAGAQLRWRGLMIAVPFLIILYYPHHPRVTIDAATIKQPNIILIGVDAVRPDFLSYFGADHRTAFFDHFLQQATVFGEAVTPLARTFPSWVGILTGKYPRESGIRFDLASQQKVDFSHALPMILKRQGYQTVYATDETRFSNIGSQIGFDHIMTPPTGLNDFLLGTFNDFPLSNLLINTTLGKYLFPYSYANRPVNFTYDPTSFLKLMAPQLATNRTQPMMLAVHFCLAHSPYSWGSHQASGHTALENYMASVQRLDQQLADFFQLLQKNKLLDHAIVVLFSDHGEALELNGDRITEKEGFLGDQKKLPAFYPPSLDKEAINQSAGHGTDVLGLSQYHSLLAFRLFGLGQQRKGEVSGRVSLLAIKPTVLGLMGRSISLAGVIRGEQSAVSSDLPIFLESDFSPEAVRTVYPDMSKVMLEGLQLFQVDPVTTRLTVKEDMGAMIIKSKQLADIDGHWMLALYPEANGTRTPILIDLATGEWTNDLGIPFAKHSPAQKMLAAMRLFYGDEIGPATVIPAKAGIHR